MKKPRRSSVGVLLVAAAFCAGAYALPPFFPIRPASDDASVTTLRATGSALARFSDDAVTAAEKKSSQLQSTYWTDDAFLGWRRRTVKDAWLVQDLGAANAGFPREKRFAFQRPTATDQDWPEILALLDALEQAPAAAVQSVTLSVRPGYAESRRFSQCVLVAKFYFGSPNPSSHP